MKLVTCERPIRVINNDRVLYVPCGHCKSCLLKKQRHQIDRNQIINGQYPYKALITLTYDNDSVPSIKRHCPTVVSIVRKNQYLKRYIINKVIPHGTKVLYRKDLQDFIKRLRINTQRHGYLSPLSFQTCGEYGPQTLRPHYHVLMYAQSMEVLHFTQNNLRKMWSFSSLSSYVFEYASGKIDYLAKYLASLNHLPHWLLVSYWRPFCRGSKLSNKAEFSCPQTSKFEVFQKGPLYWRCQNNKAVLDCISDTLITTYAPKHQGYNKATYSDRVRLYIKYVQGRYVRSLKSNNNSLEQNLQSLLFSYTDYYWFRVIQSYGHITDNTGTVYNFPPWLVIKRLDQIHYQIAQFRLKQQYEEQNALLLSSPKKRKEILLCLYSASIKELPDNYNSNPLFCDAVISCLGLSRRDLYTRFRLKASVKRNLIDNQWLRELQLKSIDDFYKQSKIKYFNDSFNTINHG